MIRALIHICVAFVLAFQLHSIFASETIKIAFVSAFSGPTALLSEEIMKDFRAAADIVNSRTGPSSGRPIEILAFDNNANVQDSLIALKRAIDEGISFVAAGRSNIALAISDALQKHNERNPDHRVLLFITEAGDPVLTESKCNFWTFRFNGHIDMDVNVLTDYMAKLPNIKKVYLLNEDYAAGQSMSYAARAMLSAKRPDIQIVADDLIPLMKVKDFAPYISKIRSTGADSVFTGNFGNDLSLLIKAGTETGLNVTYFTNRGGIPGTWANLSGGAQVISLDPWHINGADAVWQARLMSYKTKYKAISNMDWLPPMRIVEMLAAAVTLAGTAEPIKVAYALEGMKFAGPSGDSWMRAEDHQMISPIYILRLTKAGQPGVQYDVDASSYGWKTDTIISGKDTIPSMKCKMERPPMQ